MQNELETLLRRWAVIAPDEIRILDDEEKAILSCMGEEINWISMELGALFQDAQIEYHARQCIEARAWGWEIAYDQIQRLCQAIVNVEYSTGHIGSEWMPSPAAALLTAYLSALEAQNADEKTA